MKNNLLALLAASSAALLMIACGGGSDGTTSSSTTTTPPTTTAGTTISGSAVKGPVANATVTVRNAATGAVIGTTTTNASGAYTINVSFTGDVIVEVSGGTYVDEATNATTSLSTPMKVVVTANGGNVTGVVTPLTTMAFTSAFGTAGSNVTASAFNTSAGRIANQFQLNGVNLATTLPSVSGTVNSYGQALRGLSKYLQTQNATLQTVTNTTFTSTQLAAFATAYTSAYNAINPGSSVTFSFDGTAFNVSGTGAGGGTGTCGVNVTGSVSAQGITVPLNLNYCITGIAAGSCGSGNPTLSQAVSGQGGVAGAVNLTYTYAPTCAAGAITINLQ
jgi:hypothetical protein